jgi:hypothetical protein
MAAELVARRREDGAPSLTLEQRRADPFIEQLHAPIEGRLGGPTRFF